LDAGRLIKLLSSGQAAADKLGIYLAASFVSYNFTVFEGCSHSLMVRSSFKEGILKGSSGKYLTFWRGIILTFLWVRSVKRV